MIGETRVARLLSGVRGRPRVDVDGLVGALVRMGRLAETMAGCWTSSTSTRAW